MDLLAFDPGELYFDEVQPEPVMALLDQAAESYGSPAAEIALQEAQRLCPNSLMVLVGLYRFHYYQHRYVDALGIAERVLTVVAPQLGFPAHWADLDEACVARALAVAPGLTRFYLLALKGAGYLCLRLNRFEAGRAILQHLADLDEADRLGVRLLLDVLRGHSAQIIPFPVSVPELETLP